MLFRSLDLAGDAVLCRVRVRSVAGRRDEGAHLLEEVVGDNGSDGSALIVELDLEVLALQVNGSA